MHSKLDIGLGMSQDRGTRVILVRHAQSTYDEPGRYQGRWDDSALTEKGRIYAYQTGLALKEQSIDAIYTSPFRCTQQTAHEILAAISTATDNLPPLYVPPLYVGDKLQEIDSLSFPYIREQFAEECRCWKERPHEFQREISQTESSMPARNIAVADPVKPQCFPVLDFYEQARQFWQAILPRHVGQTVLLVSHECVNRALISTAIGLTPDEYYVLEQSNCGISVLNFSNGWRDLARLEVLNFTAHLGETLPKLKEEERGLRLLLVSSKGSERYPLQKLAEFLKQETINFSLSSDSTSAHRSAEQILQYHPMTVQLQVLREDFPQVWQQEILNRRSLKTSALNNSNPLITGLVVARNPAIKSILGQVLGLDPKQFGVLDLNHQALSVVHYPCTEGQPVLQALNIAGNVITQ